ncbi:Solute carrier family 35 member B1 [Orchesella cincta]|uniref:Solute carrier family 35 member B1 n=1 Tax=Orchesella cincta TaxID=48709 RepID=A0A1D2NHU4_ORCCI|nr:Solute carrier family 35 member B1 [Orchesella cincta]
MNRTAKFFGTAIGIFVCFFYYGILQEAITKGKYEQKVTNADGTVEITNEKFVYSLSLVSIQCIVNYAYAQILLQTIQREKPTDAVVETRLYGVCALTYLLAMVSSNMALQWVSYPTQVIGKSCKPIPVMLLGVLLANRRYALRKYLFVLLIVVGIGLFMYKPKQSSSNPNVFSTGELLLVMSLAMDGLTGAIQERMRANNQKPNSAVMMKMMNLFSIGYTLVALVLSSEIYSFIGFVINHPEVVWKIFSFTVASALGQFFIFVMVSDFGPLPCSIVTTTRKFFTVLASVILFGNVLSTTQWTGAFLVFVGLGLDSLYGGK